ncbi:MAG: hypothetical protein WHU10_08875 [Fimbriimonadales bacterium]
MHEGSRYVVPSWVVEAVRDRAWFEPTWRRLVLFIAKRVRQYQLASKGRGEQQVAANSAEDLVQEAFKKILTGERRVPSRIQTRDQFQRWLFDVVASVLSNEGKSAEHKSTAVLPPTTEDGEELSLEEWVGDLLWRDESSLHDWWIVARERLADEPDLLETLKAAIDGCVKPQDYEAYLGVEVEEVVNRLRRLKRRFRDLME